MNKNRPPLNLFFVLIPAIISSLFTSGTYLTVIPSFLLIIFSYYNNFRFQRNSFNSTISCLMIVGVSLLLHSFIITDLPTGNGPHIMAASMIVLMVYLWYYENPKVTQSLIFLLCLLVMIFTGNNLNNENTIYPLIIYFYIPMIMTYFFSINKKIGYKKIFLLLVGIFTINISAFYLNQFLFFADDKLNLLLQDIIQKTDYDNKQGLSSQIDIQHQVDLKLSKKPLILYKGTNPQYLRSEILINYSRKSWTPIQKTLGDPIKFDFNDKKMMTYDKNSLKKISNFNTSKTSSISFLESTKIPALPVNTLAFSSGDFKIKPYNTITSNTNLNYIDIYTINKNDLDYDKQNDETDIDRELKNSLINLSNKITENDKDNLSKAQSILNYFQNYNYSLKVAFDNDKEPIIDFIFNKKSGFCLHFASAMTLMLRSIDVPAHLVSGYIVHEYNKNMQSYVIRERDAHAWVEVYDKNSNSWKRFDPTPASQMAQYMTTDSSIIDQVILYLKSYIISFKSMSSLFSMDNLQKIGQSTYSLFILIILTLFIVFRNYKFKNDDLLLDNHSKLFLKSLNKDLKKHKIEFNDNMTYNELIIKISKNEIINESLKNELINKIDSYQTKKYNILK